MSLYSTWCKLCNLQKEKLDTLLATRVGALALDYTRFCIKAIPEHFFSPRDINNLEPQTKAIC